MIRRVVWWLLCLVMVAGAVACAGEKGASGQMSPGIITGQGKAAVSDCLYREKLCSSLRTAPDSIVAINNALSAAQQKSRSEELVACGNNSSCKASVREHYAKEYDKVQEQINACSTATECVAVAKEMKQWQADIRARSDELAAKARSEGIDSLTPAEKREWINLRGAQSNFDGSINTLIYRAEMFGGSEETTTELVNIFGHAAIANAAGAVAGAGKSSNSSSKGSAIPVPEPVTANNGLVYKSNPKHTLGQQGNRPNAGIEPKDSITLFEQSIPSTKQYPNKEVRYAVDGQGNVHRFEGTNGQYHWNGSTGDKNALTSDQIPSAVQKKLGVRIK